MDTSESFYSKQLPPQHVSVSGLHATHSDDGKLVGSLVPASAAPVASTQAPAVAADFKFVYPLHYQPQLQRSQQVDRSLWCPRLYVRYLPPAFDIEDLNFLFYSYGNLVDIHRPDGKDFAFVEFETLEEAVNAMDAVHDLPVDNRRLLINFAVPVNRGGPAPMSR